MRIYTNRDKISWYFRRFEEKEEWTCSKITVWIFPLNYYEVFTSRISIGIKKTFFRKFQKVLFHLFCLSLFWTLREEKCQSNFPFVLKKQYITCLFSQDCRVIKFGKNFFQPSFFRKWVQDFLLKEKVRIYSSFKWNFFSFIFKFFWMSEIPKKE